MTSHPRPLSLILLATLFTLAGSLHFLIPAPYLRLMPPYLPAHLLLVQISGAAEIAGGLGLLYPPTQRLAAWGLVALLIAVFPANLYMATAHLPAPGIAGQSWLQWARLPLQIPLIFWAYTCTRPN